MVMVYKGIKFLTIIIVILGIAVACSSSSSTKNTSPPAIALTLEASGFTSPVHITNAGDGSGRIFVVERAGVIKIVKNGLISVTPFLDISWRVGTDGEGGLLSLAFPPEYAMKNYFYVYYTDLQGDTVVARYHLFNDPDIADPNSEEVVFTAAQPFANHNGGQIAFGPDGYLYIGLGDGGGGGDPQGNGQNPGTVLGKMLRIDTESGAAPYEVPQDNPFMDDPAYQPEIWALGLRNPWRFSFDSLTGDLYIGDVGQATYEEIDLQQASSHGGENYGWNIMEGMHCYNNATCDQTGLTLPISEYDHSEGCSVTGGHVYRGTLYPSLNGYYLFGDYCSGRIWGLKGTGSLPELILDTDLSIGTFGRDETGELYVADLTGGGVYKIVVNP